ncbi:MAG: AsnC family transcriptional regulator [Candidatus Nitrosocaldaceae archaeon]|nr:MAG: AsnC family transcriptional regulator [Candidatus Nitrosocaldaceae archaeon]
MLNRYDELDMNILSELSRDASISVPKLAKKLGINASVIYSRIKRLVKRGVIKRFTIIINDEALGINVRAIIGINMDPKHRQTVRKSLMEIAEIRSIAEVSGRFDVLVTVGAKNLEDLHSIVMDKIGEIQGITNTETFVEMQRYDKEYDLTPLLQTR